MRKHIIIGECTLDLVFPQDTHRDLVAVTAMPGGRLLNAAAMLGSAGKPTCYVSECARDRSGDMLVAFLERHGVNTASIDRFTDGITPMNLRFLPEGDIVCSRTWPKERFDVVWPRIDNDDIVVFGTYFSLDPRVRPQLIELLQHAAERKAIIIYVPGLSPEPKSGITKLMPDILENLEIASVVLTRSSDLGVIFNESDSARAYERHIRFYCDTYVNINMPASTIEVYHRDTKESYHCPGLVDDLHTNAGLVAGLVNAIGECGLCLGELSSLSSGAVARIAQKTGDYAINTTR